MSHHDDTEHRREELPEHETRQEGNTGGGLTGFGVSAEQRGPVNEEVVEARGDDDLVVDEDQSPPSNRSS